MTYVMSDIHGEYTLLLELLEKLSLGEDDVLYVLGDMLDRGPDPIQVLFALMRLPQAICLVGNHELMALQCLSLLQKEITEETISQLDPMLVERLLIWQGNGSLPTITGFRRLSPPQREDMLDFLQDLTAYEEVEAGGRRYLLVHAGLGGFSPDKPLEDYTIEQLVWERPDYHRDYFPDVYTITGHTPTQLIEGNPRPGYIYRQGRHIAIDCGACFAGGRLAALCLETGEEFYSSTNHGD